VDQRRVATFNGKSGIPEKTAALLTVDYLTERGEWADGKLLDRLLKRVPDVPPIPGDELPGTRPSCGRRSGNR